MDRTPEQAINKIEILAEQIRKTASANSVEAFCFIESHKKGTKRIGHYSPALVKSLMVEILTVHPEQAFGVLREYSKVISEQKMFLPDPLEASPATPDSTEPVPAEAGSEASPSGPDLFSELSSDPPVEQ